jgi:hypothetical protein
MAIERQPLEQLETAKASSNPKLSGFGKLQSSLVRDARRRVGLTDSTTLWKARRHLVRRASAVRSPPSPAPQPAATRQRAASWPRADVPAAPSRPPASQPLLGGHADDRARRLGRRPLSGFTPRPATPVTITSGPAKTRWRRCATRSTTPARASPPPSSTTPAVRAWCCVATTGAENGFRITASETTDDGDDDAACRRWPSTRERQPASACATSPPPTPRPPSTASPSSRRATRWSTYRRRDADAVEEDHRPGGRDRQHRHRAIKTAMDTFVKRLQRPGQAHPRPDQVRRGQQVGRPLQGDRTGHGPAAPAARP